MRPTTYFSYQVLVTFFGVVLITVFVVAGRLLGCLYLVLELESAFLLGYLVAALRGVTLCLW